MQQRATTTGAGTADAVGGPSALIRRRWVWVVVVYAAVAGLLIAVGGWTSPILLLGLAAGLVPVVANNVWQLGRWWCAQRRRRVAQVR